MEKNLAKKIECIKCHIQKAQNIVVLLGIEMLVEGGGKNLAENEETYRIEEEYSYSPDEILSGGFYCAKKERFFQFYKKEIAGMVIRETPTYEALRKLQEAGKLKAVINQNYHGIPANAGLKNVIELNGSIHDNHCPKCGKRFPLAYILNSKGVPQCDSCKTAIRPGVRLLGERINNNRLTEASNACEKADIIIILGTNMHNDLVKYRNDKEHPQMKILITTKKHYKDYEADFTIYDEIQKIVPQLI